MISRTLMIAVTAITLACGVARASADEGLDKLLASYKRHTTELVKPLREKLAKEIRGLEQAISTDGNLEAALQLREARIEYFLEPWSSFGDDSFPLDLEKFSAQHAKGAAKMQALWERYVSQSRRATGPPQKKLAVELKKLEVRLTKMGQIRAALESQRCRESVEAYLAWPETLRSLPEGVREWNGHYYLFVEEKVSWPEAKERCEELGGHLVTVSSAKEYAFLLELGRRKNCWYGATVLNPEKEWGWVTGEPFDYTSWHPGEPSGDGDGSGEPFLGYNAHWKNWNDELPTTKSRFICEWDPPRVALEP